MSPHLIKNFDELVAMRKGREATLRRAVLEAAEAGVKAVMPENFMKKLRVSGRVLKIDGAVKIDLRRFDEIVVLGAGKASIGMAKYVEKILRGRISGGAVIVPKQLREGHGLKKIEVMPSTHPLPSDLGLKASEKLLEYAENVSERTLVIFLLSGGASALMPYPAPGIPLEDKIETTRLLLESGATIDEVNAVRKHLSMIKGGWLGKKLSKARVLTLILSDVVGDKIETIGSGPTAPDPTTFKDAYEIMMRYQIWDKAPESVKERILKGVRGEVDETPKPGDPAFKKITNIVIAGISDACAAAVKKLRSKKFKAAVITRYAEGEASQIGIFLAGVLREMQQSKGRKAAVCGGETTVTVRGNGVGGRNQELALAASINMRDLGRAVLVSMGTDGVDGVSDAAGAIVDSKTYADAVAHGLTPPKYLVENDSNTFFREVGGAIYTGPTGTNVGDLIILASERA